jgi:hypothetical protein
VCGSTVHRFIFRNERTKERMNERTALARQGQRPANVVT